MTGRFVKLFMKSSIGLDYLLIINAHTAAPRDTEQVGSVRARARARVCEFRIFAPLNGAKRQYKGNDYLTIVSCQILAMSYRFFPRARRTMNFNLTSRYVTVTKFLQFFRTSPEFSRRVAKVRYKSVSSAPPPRENDER